MAKQLPTDPAWFLAQRGYHAQALAPVPVSTLTRIGRWATGNPSKIWPAAAALGTLGLARWFHADGAADALNIAVLTAMAVAAGAAAVVSAAKQHGDSALTASLFATSAGLAVFEVASMTPHLPLALFLTLAPLLIAYAFGAVSWRDDRRSREQRGHEKELAELASRTDLQLAQIQLQERRETGLYAVALAEALQHRTGLSAGDGQVLPGIVLDAAPARALAPAPAEDQYGDLLRSSLLQPTAEQLIAWTTNRTTDRRTS